MVFRKDRLGVKCVDMGGPSIEEDVDNPFGFRCEMRLARHQGRLAGAQQLGTREGESDSAKTHPQPVHKVTPVQ